MASEQGVLTNKEGVSETSERQNGSLSAVRNAWRIDAIAQAERGTERERDQSRRGTLNDSGGAAAEGESKLIRSGLREEFDCTLPLPLETHFSQQR